MNSIGDGRKRSTLKPGSPLQRVRRVSLDLATVSPAREKCRPRPPHGQAPRLVREETEIDGVVTRRNVNPGNDVQVGQSLMAIRSLSEIWVDANFKETQLRDLRIGQAADLYVDMYGHRQVFNGRISGFTIGTGSTLALLPPQNATGNFVKIVQRLPVRIEIEGEEVGLELMPMESAQVGG
jgi:HlyD family secretion protein